MDLREPTSNAIDSASDRGGNMVKSNPPLPPGFRARPQGPPGPRPPPNNVPIGQPRPGGQPQHIRFDARSPVGPPNPGQFVQLRPYGPPRPPGQSFPQKQPQQHQNPPIILNPRFGPAPANKFGPQQGPRPPHPAAFQGQQFQRNVPRFQQPGFEQQNPYQQARHPEILARPQEIAQRQLQRNESLLNIPQQTFPNKVQEKKPVTPRIVVENMADVDNTRKLQQFENAGPKGRAESAENDDDDDVVMDGKKSPRPDSNVPNQQDLIESKLSNKENGIQLVKRPETATINGKVEAKTEDASIEKNNEKLNTSSANVKAEQSINDFSSMKTDNKISSMKPDGTKNNKLEESTEKADLGKDDTTKATMQKSPTPVPVVSNDKPNNTQLSNEQRLKTSIKVEDKGQNEENNLPSKSPSKSATPPETNQNQTEQESRVLSASSDKSRASTPAETGQSQNKQELQTPSRTPDKSRASTPAEVNQNKDDQELKTPSKSPDKSRASTPAETSQTKDEQELKTPDKSRTSTPAETSQTKEDDRELKTPDKPRASTPAEISQNKTESDLKVPSKPSSASRASTSTEGEQSKDQLSKSADKSRVSSPLEKHQIQDEDKTKAQADQSQKEQESKPPTPKSVPTEVKESQNEQKTKPTSKDLDKSQPNLPEEASESSKQESRPQSSQKPPETASIEINLNEKELKDQLPKESLNVTRPNTPAVVNQISKDESSEKASTRLAESSPKGLSETQKPPTSPVAAEKEEKLSAPESVLSPPKSPDESVKGFDNGERRSLSAKSSPSSPHSPVSPKSPSNDTKLLDDEKKKTTFVEDTVNQKEDDTELKTVSKPSTAKVQRAPTPAKLDNGSRKKPTVATELENGNATNESAQSCMLPTTNGVEDSPTKKSPSKSKDADKRSTAGSPVKSPSKSVKSLPRTPETPTSTASLDKKKLPMNKVQVGSAPSPNLKTVRSKIGSLENASYKPGGGKVKIESRKLDFSKAQPKIAAKNEKYTPSGGDKKISQVKLQWNAKPKVGSLENATYKPGGGDKKIETVKLDFKDKAKPKVGSKDNTKHVPGGGSVKSLATPPKTPQDASNDIQTQKLDIKAESKIGSLDNVKHKPGGGDKKIFDDKDYLRQTGSNVESLSGSGSQSPVPPGTVAIGKNGLPISDENLNQEC